VHVLVCVTVIVNDWCPGLLEFDIDMASFMTAFSVNVGILTTYYLEPILPSATIPISDLEFEHNNVWVRVYVCMCVCVLECVFVCLCECEVV
jgi:hypothetical protein